MSMESQSVAARYTCALFDVAQKGDLTVVREELSVIRGVLEASSDFAFFVSNPLIPRDQQENVLRSLFEGKVSELVMNFLLLLVRKQRLAILAPVLDQFDARVDEAQGVQPVEIVSAAPLSSEQLEDLCEKLRQKTGKIIRPHLKLDDSLIAGFRVRIGDRIQDYSIATKLAQFKQNVINA